MIYQTLIQSISDAPDGLEAFEQLAFLKIQVDFVAGRVLPPSSKTTGWQVQAFFENAECDNKWLPDGMRRVMVPESLLRVCVQ